MQCDCVNKQNNAEEEFQLACIISLRKMSTKDCQKLWLDYKKMSTKMSDACRLFNHILGKR